MFTKFSKNTYNNGLSIVTISIKCPPHKSMEETSRGEANGEQCIKPVWSLNLTNFYGHNKYCNKILMFTTMTNVQDALSSGRKHHKNSVSMAGK